MIDRNSVTASDDKVALLDKAASPPLPWIIVMCVVAMVAALDIGAAESGGVRWHLSVGMVSVVAIALIWLPTLLRYFFVVGGSVRAAGVEATTSGLIYSDRFIGDLAEVKTKVERIGQTTPGAKPAVRQIDTALDSMAAQYVEADSALSQRILNDAARRYEDIRNTMPPGEARTWEMDNLVNQIRLRATAAPSAAAQFAGPLLRSAKPGDRIVGLALVEGAPRVGQFNDTLRIFGNSETAFEMFHGIRALSALVPQLSREERDKAILALVEEKADPRGVGVMQDAYIPGAIDRLIDDLQS